MLTIAIPAYDRKLTIQTARSLLDEQNAAFMLKTSFSVMFAPGCSLITMARNSICRDFLASKSDRLVFLDSDVAWECGSLLKLASYPVDIVGGAYRYKAEEEKYAVYFRPDDKGGISTNDMGLVEVDALPGGFLSISRNALERIRAARPERTYHWNGQEFYAYFENQFQSGYMVGEDIGFCLFARGCGETIYLDPSLRLTHVDGSHEYTGRIEDWLREGKWRKTS